MQDDFDEDNLEQYLIEQKELNDLKLLETHLTYTRALNLMEGISAQIAYLKGSGSFDDEPELSNAVIFLGVQVALLEIDLGRRVKSCLEVIEMNAAAEKQADIRQEYLKKQDPHS